MALLFFKSPTAEHLLKTVFFFSPDKVHTKDHPVTASQLQGPRAEALPRTCYGWGTAKPLPAFLICRITGEKCS